MRGRPGREAGLAGAVHRHHRAHRTLRHQADLQKVVREDLDAVGSEGLQVYAVAQIAKAVEVDRDGVDGAISITERGSPPALSATRSPSSE